MAEDLNPLEKIIRDYIIKSMEYGVSVADQTAMNRIYSNAKYYQNITRESRKVDITATENDVKAKYTIAPRNPRSNMKHYAEALDIGHDLVYHGKPTNRFVRGKNFVYPAIQTGEKALEESLDLLMR